MNMNDKDMFATQWRTKIHGEITIAKITPYTSIVALNGNEFRG